MFTLVEPDMGVRMDKSEDILVEVEQVRQHVVALVEAQGQIAASVVDALDRLTSAAEDITLTMHLSTIIMAAAAIVGIRQWTTVEAVAEVRKMYEAMHMNGTSENG